MEAQRQAELDINAKYDQLEIEARERKQQSILNTARNTLGLLSELNAAFAGESETEQKEAFVRQKKFSQPKPLSLPTSAVKRLRVWQVPSWPGARCGSGSSGNGNGLGQCPTHPATIF